MADPTAAELVLSFDPTRTTNAVAITDAAILGYLSGEVLDLTVGPEAGFWAKWRPDPEGFITNDLDPQVVADWHYDARATPWPDDWVDSVVYDPPYKYQGTDALASIGATGTTGPTAAPPRLTTSWWRGPLRPSAWPAATPWSSARTNVSAGGIDPRPPSWLRRPWRWEPGWSMSCTWWEATGPAHRQAPARGVGVPLHAHGPGSSGAGASERRQACTPRRRGAQRHGQECMRGHGGTPFLMGGSDRDHGHTDFVARARNLGEHPERPRGSPESADIRPRPPEPPPQPHPTSAPSEDSGAGWPRFLSLHEASSTRQH